ncbi:hypothetical protein [Erwinia tasmaniensis]|uniref:Uncharacterized protein n=1 Tax=Erwinia tasmaniensis (strain DSM 17950 / CFBP 7177 / CIP 109463 / NCPPB 4357 / Et1/99) TaxID=465817 RepID=B2VID5_ERWT9|nr:hypothetical protein [Erwinia tasmaniensis]CAO96961.1 hypothetical protein ETA_19150 [Erwinia tasmaniensis Et1/99]
MRKITENELPTDSYSNILIKSSLVSRYQRLSSALERTLIHCNQIHLEYESRKDELQERYQKEGYTAGLQLIFSQLTMMLDDYEQQHSTRIEKLKSLINDAVRTSFDDPVIVERIIYHIKRICKQQNIRKIIVPRTVQFKDDADLSDYIFTDGSDITLQGDKEAVRFQSTSLCQQWLEQAAVEMSSIDENINKIVPDFLYEMGQKLITLSHKRNK